MTRQYQDEKGTQPLTLYIAVMQFTIGKLRYCYVKSQEFKSGYQFMLVANSFSKCVIELGNE